MTCNCNQPTQKAATGCGVVTEIIHSDYQNVIIPRELGTSAAGQPYAPKVGAYKNAIVSYRADGLSYVYDKNGRYSLLSNTNATVTTVDDALSTTSENPVQNKVVTEYINNHGARLTTVEGKVVENTQDIGTNAGNITALGNRVTALEGSSTDYGSRITSAEDDILSLDGRMDTAEDDIDALEDAVSALTPGGEPNIIEAVQENGQTLTVTNKTVNVTVPTNVSDLTNDSGYQNATQVADAIRNSAYELPPASTDTLGGIKLTISTTDIGEGATLAANTLYCVVAS